MVTFITNNIGSGFSIVNPIIDAPKVILNGQKIFAGWTNGADNDSLIVNYPCSHGTYTISSAGEFSFNAKHM